MKIAVIGATGLVGSEIIKVIQERKLPVSNFLPVASSKSFGKKLTFNNKDYKILSIENALKQKPKIVIFSAGSEISREFAPLFAKSGAYVIDNSSQWRMQENVPLIVPEVNIALINKNTRIIANPNCSTIQLVVALYPLHKQYQIKRIVISTYQSVTGSGYLAVKQLFDERNNIDSEKLYPHRIDLNCFPFAGSFNEDAYTSEERKLVFETRKIFNDKTIKISPTVVRVPVTGGHSESVNVEFYKVIRMEMVRRLLNSAPGIIVQDEPAKNLYPMPINAEGRDEVFVGRIRRDFCSPRILNLWIVADNLRKGAATNAVQIAEHIYNNII